MTEMIFPIHLLQKKRLADPPKARMVIKTRPNGAAMKASMAAHLEMIIPNGARNIPAIPMNIMRATFGIRTMRPPYPRYPCCRYFARPYPTHRKRSDFAMAWKMISRIATHMRL